MAIVDLHRSDVETDIEGGVEFSFSKDAASKLYQMMSNYLYSDKEYAVISELSANAVDAHALVGKHETPISIQLPTRLDSEFVVRDFGPGLPEHDVYRFLTSYGESSKGDSNDQIGFWGIGAKSPAAVSDTWSVISYHDGKRSHYEVFITESGIPTLKKIFEGATDQTGLEVRVPVPTNNHSQWLTAAKRAFKHYSVKPSVNEDLKFVEDAYSYRGNGWAKIKASTYGTSGRLIITMREYELDYAKIMAEIPAQSPVRNLFGGGTNWAGINFMFGVGEINLSISREQIQYDTKTIEAIKAKLNTVYEEFKALIEADLNAATESLDYRKRLNVWFNEGVSPAFLQHIVAGKYGITVIPRDIARFSSANIPDLEKQNIQVVSRGRMKKVTGSFSCWSSNAISVNRQWDSTRQEYDSTVGLAISQLEHIQVVIRDVRNAISRLKFSGDDKTYYLLADESPFPADIKTVLASSFARPPSDAKKNDRGTLSGFYQLNGNRFLKIDETQFKYVTRNPEVIAVKIGNATTAANDSTVTDPKVKFLVQHGWALVGYKKQKPRSIKTPDQGLKFMFDQMDADPDFKVILENQATNHLFKQVETSNIALFAAKVKKVDSAKWNDIISPMKMVCDYYAANGSTPPNTYPPSRFYKWTNLCRLLEVDDKASKVIDLAPMIEVLNDRYPLLKHLYQRWYGDVLEEKAAIAYIKLIDNKI